MRLPAPGRFGPIRTRPSASTSSGRIRGINTGQYSQSSRTVRNSGLTGFTPPSGIVLVQHCNPRAAQSPVPRFLTRAGGLESGKEPRTPAMQAGLAGRRLSSEPVC